MNDQIEKINIDVAEVIDKYEYIRESLLKENQNLKEEIAKYEESKGLIEKRIGELIEKIDELKSRNVDLEVLKCGFDGMNINMENVVKCVGDYENEIRKQIRLLEMKKAYYMNKYSIDLHLIKDENLLKVVVKSSPEFTINFKLGDHVRAYYDDQSRLKQLANEKRDWLDKSIENFNKNQNLKETIRSICDYFRQ